MTSQTDLQHARELCLAGDLDAAYDAFRALIDRQPDQAAPWVGLGDVHRAAGRLDEAISAYRDAISRDNGSWEAWAALGRVFLDRGLAADARMALARAVKRNEDAIEVRHALAEALQRLGRADEAVVIVRGSLARQPDSAMLHLQLGELLLDQGGIDDSIAAFRQALGLVPDDPMAHVSLGRALERGGRLQLAADSYARALELAPGHADAGLGWLTVQQRLCAWDAVDAFADAAGTGDAVALSPAATLALGLPAEHQLAAARARAASLQVVPLPPLPASVFDIRPIIVGYLSADFADNAIGRLVAPILEAHDRTKVRVAAFSCGPDDRSEVRKRIKRAVDDFVDLRFHGDDAAAREIRNRGIQILVDLSGYRRGARPAILARRAAPVQIGYLGYPGTLGDGLNDHLVVDDYLLPAGAESSCDETPWRMPGAILAAEPAEVTLVGRRDCGLPEAAFVFASPADTVTITEAVAETWMTLLRDVPASVLWFNGCADEPRVRLQAVAHRIGVDPARLVFTPLANPADLAGRYRHADLLLDTWPCNAPASALEALRGGCPVLTSAGDSIVARMTGSLLHAIGMDDMICAGREAYHAQAVALACDPDRLNAARQRLHHAQRSAALFDVPRFVATLEAAYDRILDSRARGGAVRAKHGYS